MNIERMIWKLAAVILLLIPCSATAKKIIEIKPSDGDQTLEIREAIEAETDTEIKIVFAKGTYKFSPKYASEKYCYITNHGNGLKHIAFLFEDKTSVEIEGNGSEFIFHGHIFPFQFTNCQKVSVNNITVDWDIPFNFAGEVIAVNEEEGYRDIKPLTEGFSWKLKKGKLHYPDVDGFSFNEVGSTLAFDPVHKRVAHGAWDFSSNPTSVEKRPDGILRFHEKLRNYPPVGSLLNSKGGKSQSRYAPAFHFVSSNNIKLTGLTVHHALGMGYLYERCEGIVMQNCGVYVRKGSPRVVSAIADATHFCNCKGDILVEDCRFQHMLDDGTNVHGTYVEVDEVVNEKTVRVRLKHFEQMGFQFAEAGDEVWFIQVPSPQRGTTNKITNVKVINGKYSELTFENPVPNKLAEGDILENKTWNPTFTMRGCTISDHRARNIVIKTPKKIIIEDNDLSSMMSSILFRGETYFWFESGGVQDVLIRNNRFKHCAYSGSDHAIMYVTPRLGKTFNQNELYDRNIRFEDNTIENFANRIVRADRVEGLTISGNKITQTKDAKQLYPDTYMFDFTDCKDVTVVNNKYKGINEKGVKADLFTEKTLKVKKNKGINQKVLIAQNPKKLPTKKVKQH